MKSFSLDRESENIKNSKTREYFGEVMQSYGNGSYRSATVMLYSVVISDLIYKLKDLKDLYEDKAAIRILDEIKRRQKNKPESSGWESYLITEIKDSTSLLEPIDKSNLLYLREQRHLSAHPVLNAEDTLSSPDRDAVRSMMRNMLQGILTKSPVMSTKVFDVILEDLAKNEDSFIGNNLLERYLESRYFVNVNDRTAESIFKNLWTVTFDKDNELCEKHRDINYKALKIIYKKYMKNLNEYIANNVDYFSQKFDLKNEKSLIYLFSMLGDFPVIYQLLSNHAKGLLENISKKNWKMRVVARFLSDSTFNHFKMLNEEFNGTQNEGSDISEYQINSFNKWIQEVETDSERIECMNLLNALFIKYFTSSGSFDLAVSNFNNYINPYLNSFSEENFLCLFKGINDNSQCLNHRLAIQHNSIIKKYADEVLEPSFNYGVEFPRISFS